MGLIRPKGRGTGHNMGRPRLTPAKTPVVRVEDELNYGRIPSDCYLMQVTTRLKDNNIWSAVKTIILTVSEAEALATVEKKVKQLREEAAVDARVRFQVQLLRVDIVSNTIVPTPVEQAPQSAIPLIQEE